MLSLVTPEMYDEYDRFVESHEKGHFMQTRMWADLKNMWEWAALVSRDEAGDIKGSLAFLIRKAPGLPYTFMYGCRGPVCSEGDAETIAELLSGAKELAHRKKAYMIKLDPDVPAADEGFARALTAGGFSAPGQNKNFEGIQPRFVFRLDIGGRTEENILNAFESKTRYNIRLGQRKGVEVRVCGPEAVPEFSKIMEETGGRDGFTVRPAQYFTRMLEALGEHARLYMAYYEGSAVAGTIAVWFGDKVWYLYGASSNSSRNVMPNYLLQWEMICWAVEKKCRIYDFRGVSGDLSEDNPLYGLYRFKKGFSGELVEFAGEFDLILKPGVKKLTETGEKALRTAHRLARRLRGGQR